jgi:hypothetical protein
MTSPEIEPAKFRLVIVSQLTTLPRVPNVSISYYIFCTRQILEKNTSKTGQYMGFKAMIQLGGKQYFRWVWKTHETSWAN